MVDIIEIEHIESDFCEGSGDCFDCNIYDCYYNQTDDFEYETLEGVK